MNRGREDLQLWEQNQSRRFDVILLDVQMPERDGLRAPALIREKELASDAQIPIIAVTAPATKRDCERSVAAGLDGYITKPINPGELAEPIQAAFRNGTRLPAAHADPIQVGPSDAQLLARFDGDLSKEFAGIFLQECPRMLDDICEALRTGNAKALEPAAPVLKGSAGNFAMPGPWETAQRLEWLAKSGRLSGAEDILQTLQPQIVLFNQILARNTAEPALQPR